MDAACQSAEQQVTSLQKQIFEQHGRKEQIRRCLKELRKCGDNLAEFDVGLWNTMAESATVLPDNTITFHFWDGMDVPVKLPVEKPKGKITD